MSLFVSRVKPIESNKDEEESDGSEIDEKSHIKIRNTNKSQSATKKERINTGSVFQWDTSISHAAKYIRMAHQQKLQEKAKLRKVLDGANAPNITGKSRYKSLKSSHFHGLKDPASASAFYYSLSLLQ